MNQPMRYDGKAFYQASFGKGDTLSILQVVENPGWLLPYISCVLVALGLIVHFTVSLRKSSRKREAARLAQAAQEADMKKKIGKYAAWIAGGLALVVGAPHAPRARPGPRPRRGRLRRASRCWRAAG